MNNRELLRSIAKPVGVLQPVIGALFDAELLWIKADNGRGFFHVHESSSHAIYDCRFGSSAQVDFTNHLLFVWINRCDRCWITVTDQDSFL